MHLLPSSEVGRVVEQDRLGAGVLGPPGRRARARRPPGGRMGRWLGRRSGSTPALARWSPPACWAGAAPRPPRATGSLRAASTPERSRAAEGRASTHERAATLDRGGGEVAARPAGNRPVRARVQGPARGAAGEAGPCPNSGGGCASSCQRVGGRQDPGRQGSSEVRAWSARWLGSRAVAPCPVGPPAGRGAVAIGQGADRWPPRLAGWLTRGGVAGGRWGSSGARTCGS
jgi:hypothetical protein